MNTVNQLNPHQSQVHAALARPVAVRPQAAPAALRSPDSANLSGSNPYGSSYEGFVQVKPEVWSKIRGLNEPGQARNDHLAGILHNLGFSESEIYGKAPNGERLLDWIAKTNGLRHPDLIHPSDTLVLPSHLKPAQLQQKLSEAEKKTDDPALRKEIDGLKQQAQQQSPKVTTSGNGSSAATLQAPSLNNLKLLQNPQTVTGGDGQALAGVQAGTIADSQITQQPVVQAGRNGNAAAVVQADHIVNTPVLQQPLVEARQSGNSLAEVKAETIDSSPIAQSPVVVAGANGQAVAEVKAETLANSPVVQAPLVKAGQDATAVAEVKANTIENTPIVQTPVAQAGQDASALATVRADTLADSPIQQTATATGAEAPEARTQVRAGVTAGSVTINQNANASGLGAEAATGVSVGANQGDLRVQSQASGTVTDQRVNVGSSNGSLFVKLDGAATGTSNQEVNVGATPGHPLLEGSPSRGNPGPVNVQENLSGSGNGRQSVSVQDPTSPVPYYDRPRDQFAPGQVELNASGLNHSNQKVTGVQTAVVRAENNGHDARLSSDAPDARYEASNSPKVEIEHKGHSGRVEVEAQGTQRVAFEDEGAGPTHQGSRNQLDVSMQAPNVRIGATGAERMVARTAGSDGDDHHEIMLPTRDPNPVVISRLGAGNDTLSIAGQSNGSTVLVDKTDGSLDLNLNLPGARGQTETVLDLGKARLTGTLETGYAARRNSVFVRTEGAAHNASIQGAGNPDDLLVIEADGQGRLPKVVLRDGSNGFLGFGRHAEEAITPPGYAGEGVIHANGFSRILLRQDGRTVGSYGNVGEVETFQSARDRVDSTVLP